MKPETASLRPGRESAFSFVELSTRGRAFIDSVSISGRCSGEKLVLFIVNTSLLTVGWRVSDFRVRNCVDFWAFNFFTRK